eukprot:TRINITY_DN11212_c0_g1_i1.p1 TRINITY_DN11212_c0_g1~~TRINITY_DN11212_c0_g1_i1.p1  ORF type:complete len:452 (-),score=140.05 TRINITY_DN11212_c0_g1_i1:37-1257(-)
MNSAKIILKDIRPAKEVIPALNDKNRKLVLLSGPPVNWKNMGNAQKGAVQGICIFEGWANTPEEAYQLCERGEVDFEPNHHHNSAGPMAGTISPSFPLFVVENTTFKHTVYSRPADLAQQFGDFNNIEDIKWWRDGVAPSLSLGLKKRGPIDLNFALQKALEMGDEAHNRNDALCSLLSSEFALGMLQAGVPNNKIIPILEWFNYKNFATGSGVRAPLGLVMCIGKAILDPIYNIEYSTIVSCMTRNGHEFGLRVSGLGDQWFTAPAPYPEGHFFGNYKQSDVGRDMGDSAITEAAGFGAFILQGAPAFIKGLPANYEKITKITQENETITTDRSKLFQIPVFDFAGNPIGIDIKKVVDQNFEPWIDTGITHKDSGHRVIGRGFSRAPILAFKSAFEAFEKKYGKF